MNRVRIARELVRIAKSLVAQKQYACWCAYNSRGDRWVKVRANSPQEAKETALRQEKSKGIRSVVSVKECDGNGMF